MIKPMTIKRERGEVDEDNQQPAQAIFEVVIAVHRAGKREEVLLDSQTRNDTI